jgi:SAM-dependent methyltransferase
MTSRAFQWGVLCLVFAAGAAFAQAQEEPFKPVSGQAGKDVVWVPTPQATVEKMMDVANVTAQDFVMDLGSGDGRNIIAAAKRGARGLGVEYNPKMVEYSRRSAADQGVSDRAQFVEADMFTADVSKATVLALFLLPDNLRKLEQNFLTMLRPGTRIVVDTFGIPGWEAEQTETVGGDCTVWCTVMLYYVPAKVAGKWRMPQGELALEQEVQKVSGTLAGTPITKGRVRGDQVMFTAGGVEYVARVNGNALEGVPSSGQGAWKAARAD